MIIAIDGPAASGKSTTARKVAERLGYTYLDTGAMYRAVTLALLQSEISLENEESVGSLLSGIKLELKADSGRTVIFMNGNDISEEIRGSEVTAFVSAVSAQPIVREKMVSIQREIGSSTDCVIEGRDIGTVVFPNAEYKFFLVANYETRALRRQADLKALGEDLAIEDIIKDLKERDLKDSTRSHSPLQKADDAIEVDTSNLSIEGQVDEIVNNITNTEKVNPLMSESKVKEQAVEAAETTEEVVEVNVESVKEEASTATKPTVDYLDVKLFSAVKTIKKEDLEVNVEQPEVPEEIQDKYFSSFSDIQENQVITGRVIGINENDILVDIGFKSEGIINRDEFSKDDLPEIGDQLEVYLERIEDRQGNTILSKSKADFMRRWQELREAFDNETVLKGKIVKRIKGGMVVDMGVVQAFLPGSQVDVRPIQDFDRFIDEDMEFKIVKFNEARKNIVVSRKAILEESLKEQREHLFSQIKVGEILEGRVKNITDFGVFIDLGGLDGLLHITDLSWGRVNHPSDIVSMDDVITVKVIDYDEERKRVSLGLKQLSVHPWENMENKYPLDTIVKGKIVSMTNYGAFIEIEPGVEGLIHVSEMSWTRHVKNPSEMFSMGDEIEAKVLAIDSEERKISLGFKQLQPDPWDKIEEKYTVGSIYHGKVINLTQFGAFVELEEGVDGLVHVSDLSWTKVVRHPKEVVEKGQEVDVRVLEVSRENRRVSLGLKQVTDDPWPGIIKHFETGKEVSGEIIRVLDKGIILQLDKEVEGIIPFNKSSKKERKNLSRQFKTGESIKGAVMEVRPDDKKVVLFSEEIAASEKPAKPKDDVQEYLSNQEAPASQKIEIPMGDLETEEGEGDSQED